MQPRARRSPRPAPRLAPAMLTILTLLGVFALPFVGATIASPSQTLAQAPTSLVMGALLLWLLALWSITLTLAWPTLATALQALPI